MLKQYGALRGRPLAARIESTDDSPHYQIHVVAAGVRHRVAVNVQSSDHSPLLYFASETFHHPITDRLPTLAHGFSAVPHAAGGLALDFVRGNLFERQAMRVLPAKLNGPDNDLNEHLDHVIGRAIRDTTAELFAFGEPWAPERKADKVFGFRPGRGIHDIHMNQGNGPGHRSEDGIWQDGALFLHFPASRQWVAVFLAFQSQAWQTDNQGHASSSPQPLPVVNGQAARSVHIVGALVNPTGPGPEHETVTLLNASPQPVHLDGWTIVDPLQHRQALSGTLASGATLVVSLSDDLQLGNSGGTITLLDRAGLKVDGVAYTADQAAREGWTLVF